MAEKMTFPNTVEEFMEQYKITDTEHVYTNGTEMVPIFRMKQWFDHLPSAQSEPCEDVFALDDFIKELDIAIKQDGHDIYIKADGAKMLKGLLRNQMGDSISRQAAIDAMCSVCGNDCDKSEFVYDAPQWEQVILCPEHYALSVLPSVQQEIIRCKDCEYGTQDEYGRWYCRSFGCQVGDEDGSGFCADAERKDNV